MTLHYIAFVHECKKRLVLFLIGLISSDRKKKLLLLLYRSWIDHYCIESKCK